MLGFMGCLGSVKDIEALLCECDRGFRQSMDRRLFCHLHCWFWLPPPSGATVGTVVHGETPFQLGQGRPSEERVFGWIRSVLTLARSTLSFGLVCDRAYAMQAHWIWASRSAFPCCTPYPKPPPVGSQDHVHTPELLFTPPVSCFAPRGPFSILLHF